TQPSWAWTVPLAPVPADPPPSFLTPYRPREGRVDPSRGPPAQPGLAPPDTSRRPRKGPWTPLPTPPLCYVKYVASYITHCCYNYPLEAFMTTQQTPSWEAVIACHDPTQPTRYYRSYTLHYPASSSDHINTTLHHTLQSWSTGTGLTLSTQHPLLANSD